MYPRTRMRRLRANQQIRDMTAESKITVKNLVYPMFVSETITKPLPVKSMPGICSLPLNAVALEAEKACKLGIPAVLLFGIPRKKDETGSEAWNREGVVQKAIKEIKSKTEIIVIADLCLCEYTSHGHCGIVRNGDVSNDETLELYARIAYSQAEAGADMVAPSGMMDGQVLRVRRALDDGGFEKVPIMAYGAKYSSAFYSPFREAAVCAPSFGDRRSHQMDARNIREAMREMELDLNEGADILMVKPALPCLDVIAEARRSFNVPIAAYNVSGEYAMIKAAASMGWIDGEKAMKEVLFSIKRAGADIIITYFALEAAEKMVGGML